jgi:hypothetical protein
MRPKDPELSAERLRSLLHYDPITGIFTWVSKTSPYSPAPIGSRAGYVKKGYLYIKIDHRHIYAHRLAFLYMTGIWPEDFIDRKGGNKQNNSWCNLREASHGSNVANSLSRRALPKGAYKTRYNRYLSAISANGQRFYLGTFSSPEEANSAYHEAAVRHHGEFARSK